MTKVRNIWTKEECHEKALLCNSRSEFYKKYQTHYGKARKQKWLDEICSHMEIIKNSWTKEECHEKALLCNSRIEFQVKYVPCYQKAQKEKWLDEICSHMEAKLNFWTKEECHEKALLCSIRKEFQSKYKSHYSKAHREKWLDEICSHMEKIILIDTVYIWNTLENPQLWKIGVSNHYTVKTRIKTVSKAGNLNPHFKKWKVFENENVITIEKQLLSLGEPYQFTTPFDGHSEFRLLTQDEEQYIMKLLA